MSFNRIIPHPDKACVELIVDGHEDWESATDSITEMADIAENNALDRFLIDFRRVDMRVSPAEAGEIAVFFNSFCVLHFSLAVILPANQKAARTALAFAERMGELGHPVAVLETAEDREAWIDGDAPRARRIDAA